MCLFILSKSDIEASDNASHSYFTQEGVMTQEQEEKTTEATEITQEKGKKGRPKGVKEIGRKRHVKFTPEKKRAFLRQLSKHGNVRGAAGKVGISRLTVYEHMRKDPNFKERVERAKDQALGELNDEFYDRIYNGNEKLEYDEDGNLIKKTVQKDNKLLEKALESQDPDSFGKNDKRTNINVNVDGASALDKLAEFLKVEAPEKPVEGNVIDQDGEDEDY